MQETFCPQQEDVIVSLIEFGPRNLNFGVII